jgi:hypothetical protein
VLTDEEIGRFITDGYVAVRRAVPAEVAQACQDVIWSELARRGVRRDERSTWTAPLVRISCPEGGPFVEAGTAGPVQDACDQLLGPGGGGGKASAALSRYASPASKIPETPGGTSMAATRPAGKRQELMLTVAACRRVSTVCMCASIGG